MIKEQKTPSSLLNNPTSSKNPKEQTPLNMQPYTHRDKGEAEASSPWC